MYSKSILSAVVAGLFVASTSFAQGIVTPKPPRPPVPSPLPDFPDVETEPLSVGATCPSVAGQDVEVLHFAKIRFLIDRGPLTPRDNRDGFNLSRIPRGIPLTLIVRHDPEKVHNVLARVLAFLRARDDVGNRGRIEIQSTDYAAVCAVPEDEEPPAPPKPPKPHK